MHDQIDAESKWILVVRGRKGTINDGAETMAFGKGDNGFEIQDKDNLTLFDWRLDIPFFRNTVMSIGKQKEPISGERVQSMLYNHQQ